MRAMPRSAKELGLRSVVVEQKTMAASIKSFPRNKLVFDPPLDVPLEGELWLRESTKEELLVQWTRIARARALRILEHHVVTRVRRDGSLFAIVATTPDGERELSASRIVLAIGRRGTPKALDALVAPDAESRVSHALADARSFAGQRVLVVGLGDAAMEAACALARQPGTEVTVSYRGADFARGKARNIDDVKTLAARGRMRIVFESSVERVDVGRVRLVRGHGDGERTRARRDDTERSEEDESSNAHASFYAPMGAA
jgi:cation diffusion facilitator CzcD-associated flavoprotein CzcO